MCLGTVAGSAQCAAHHPHLLPMEPSYAQAALEPPTTAAPRMRPELDLRVMARVALSTPCPPPQTTTARDYTQPDFGLQMPHNGTSRSHANMTLHPRCASKNNNDLADYP